MATYTELCCRTSGSNLNAGTRTGSSTVPGGTADLTYAGGAWVNATRVFTVASGDPVADGVAVDDYVALDTGGAAAAYIARVTARTTTTITLSATGLGTNPADGTYTLRVGGAWKGPNGAATFPLSSASLTNLANAAGNLVRINLKNDATYAMTATITGAAGTCHRIRGFTTSYGDGGRATIDGGTTGASYNLFNFGAGTTNCAIEDVIFSNNGSTGSSSGVVLGGPTMLRNCVVTGMKGAGINNSSVLLICVECEVYGNNTSNTASTGGFISTGGLLLVRVMIHDHSGSNNRSIHSSGALVCIGMVCDTAGNHHVIQGTRNAAFINCDFYNAGNDGINSTSSLIYVENSRFALNGNAGSEYGVNMTSTSLGALVNCGFGSGTWANFSGNNLFGTDEIGSITYASNTSPWVDAPNGDFRPALTADKQTGRGTFVQTASSYAGTVGYPDVGAATHQDSAATGGVVVVNWG